MLAVESHFLLSLGFLGALPEKLVEVQLRCSLCRHIRRVASRWCSIRTVEASRALLPCTHEVHPPRTLRTERGTAESQSERRTPDDVVQERAKLVLMVEHRSLTSRIASATWRKHQAREVEQGVQPLADDSLDLHTEETLDQVCVVYGPLACSSLSNKSEFSVRCLPTYPCRNCNVKNLAINLGSAVGFFLPRAPSISSHPISPALNPIPSRRGRSFLPGVRPHCRCLAISRLAVLVAPHTIPTKPRATRGFSLRGLQPDSISK